MIKAISIFCVLITMCANTFAHNDEKKFYIELSGGISKPLKKGFDIEDKDDDGVTTKTKVKLDKSFMGTLGLGYMFDQSTGLEFSIDIKPKYNMNIALPNDLSCKTKAKAYVYMVNFIYNFAQLGQGTPYFTIGLGFADVKIKPTNATITHPNLGNIEAFSLPKNNPKGFSWQVGVGYNYPVSDNIDIGLSAKAQIVHDLKINYKKINKTTSQMENKSTKKTLGVGELTLDLLFRF